MDASKRVIHGLPMHPKAIDTIKTTDIATKEKWYTPMVSNKVLRKTFKARKHALNYGRRVLTRYLEMKGIIEK